MFLASVCVHSGHQALYPAAHGSRDIRGEEGQVVRVAEQHKQELSCVQEELPAYRVDERAKAGSKRHRPELRELFIGGHDNWAGGHDNCAGGRASLCVEHRCGRNMLCK